MKLQNILRMQVIVIGFAGALLLASSVSAQEIENTNWDDGPNVAPFAQPAPAPTVNDLNMAVAPAAAVSEPIANREAVVSQGTLVEGRIKAFLLVCVALAVFYGLVEAKRANRNLGARPRQVNNRAALS